MDWFLICPLQNALVENEEEKEGKDGDGEKKKGDQVKTFDLGRLRTYTFKAHIFIFILFSLQTYRQNTGIFLSISSSKNPT